MFEYVEGGQPFFQKADEDKIPVSRIDLRIAECSQPLKASPAFGEYQFSGPPDIIQVPKHEFPGIGGEAVEGPWILMLF